MALADSEWPTRDPSSLVTRHSSLVTRMLRRSAAPMRWPQVGQTRERAAIELQQFPQTASGRTGAGGAGAAEWWGAGALDGVAPFPPTPSTPGGRRGSRGSVGWSSPAAGRGTRGNWITVRAAGDSDGGADDAASAASDSPSGR